MSADLTREQAEAITGRRLLEWIDTMNAHQSVPVILIGLKYGASKGNATVCMAGGPEARDEVAGHLEEVAKSLRQQLQQEGRQQ